TILARDIDILESIREHSPVLVKITITTADDAKALMIEPGAPPSSERFALLKKLNQSGIMAGILLMPILPFVNDDEENIFRILKLAAESGARFIYPGFGVTLRMNQRIHYYEQLKKLFPEQDLPKRYNSVYGNRYSCNIPDSRKLYERFTAECAKHDILYDMKDIIHAYKRNYGEGQLSLFDF
ncbi:MAG: radical SAM protein, partial [Lachnospiraceae bacterium]|nr:radical SAM protein [Lachnospiraceae bacterium]